MTIEQHIQTFISGGSVEITPKGALKIDNFNDYVPEYSRVFITFLPGSNIQDTIDTAIRLRGEHMEPIPHLAARSIPNKEFLRDALDKLCNQAGVSKILLIGGGVDTPVGDFSDTVQLLHTGLFEQYGIKHISIAGHPEGTPDFPIEAHWQALRDKQKFSDDTGIAMHVVTQFCFEATPFINYGQELRDNGINFPLIVGVPGLATIKTLLMHAQHCGIGASMKVIKKQAANLAKIMMVKEPNKLVRDIAQHMADNPDTPITSCHLYPLGGFVKTANWAKAIGAGNFTLNNKEGFILND